MKKQILPSASELYPELDHIADRIAKDTLRDCNFWSDYVNSPMPYKAQCILEMTIKKLEARV